MPTPAATVVKFEPTPEGVAVLLGAGLVVGGAAKLLGASLLVSSLLGVAAMGAVVYVAYDIIGA